MSKNKKILITIFIIALLLDQVTKIVAYTNGWIIESNEDIKNNGYYIIIFQMIILL